MGHRPSPKEVSPRRGDPQDFGAREVLPVRLFVFLSSVQSGTRHTTVIHRVHVQPNAGKMVHGGSCRDHWSTI